LGVALQRQGQLAQAIAAYQQAIVIDPTLADAFYNLGVSLQQTGRREEAIPFLTQAKSLFNQQGNVDKIDQLNQFLQQIGAN
jgi:tetratricopeptide (TPR) repeat protein